MQKRLVMLSFILGIMLVGFVSAQYWGGGLSLSELLYNIDSSNIILGVVFIVLFAVLYFSLSRFFKDKEGRPNKVIAAIIALSVALLITYGINRTGFNIEGLFYNIGISREALYIILPILVIAGLIYAILKRRIKELFLIIGGILIVLSFFVYEKVVTLVVGIILILVGLFIKKKRGLSGDYIPRRSPFRPSQNRRRDYESSRIHPTKREIYERELKQRRYSREAKEAKVRARARNIAEIREEREKREIVRERRRQEKLRKEQIRQQRELKRQEKEEKIRARRQEEQVRQQKTEEIQRGQERQLMKYQKMIRHLEQLAQKKDMELQKQEMMAAKGVKGAEQKIRTLRGELAEIERRMKRYK